MPLFDDVKDFFTIKDDSYYYDKLYPLQDANFSPYFFSTIDKIK